jgi:hypothetical protein
MTPPGSFTLVSSHPQLLRRDRPVPKKELSCPKKTSDSSRLGTNYYLVIILVII